LRKTFKPAKRGCGIGIVARSLNVTMNPKGIGPIRLDRERAETVFLDQPLGQLRADFVKFMRPMRGFADQNNLMITCRLEERLVVRFTRDPMGHLGDSRRSACKWSHGLEQIHP
jgi:hypothetical protein